MTIFIIILVYVTSFILARWLASKAYIASDEDYEGIGCVIATFIFLPPLACIIMLIIFVKDKIEKAHWKPLYQSKFYKWLTNQK